MWDEIIFAKNASFLRKNQKETQKTAFPTNDLTLQLHKMLTMKAIAIFQKHAISSVY